MGTTLVPFVEAIPVAGVPLKAAISRLLCILTIVDVSVKSLRWQPTHTVTQKISQNKQAIKDLVFKLCELLNEIDNLSAADKDTNLWLIRNIHSNILYVSFDVCSRVYFD